jgi:hypothetical protein
MSKITATGLSHNICHIRGQAAIGTEETKSPINVRVHFAGPGGLENKDQDSCPHSRQLCTFNEAYSTKARGRMPPEGEKIGGGRTSQLISKNRQSLGHLMDARMAAEWRDLFILREKMLLRTPVIGSWSTYRVTASRLCYELRVPDSGSGTIVPTCCTLSYISLFRWDRTNSSSLSFILRLRLSSSRRTPWYMV